MIVKHASSAVLDVLQVDASRLSLIKDAHRHEFQYKPRKGFIYVRSRAISSRTNDNFDTFPAEELRQAWRTFIGKPVFVNHHNHDHTRMRGVVIDAALHEDIAPDGTEDTWVEVLMEIDAVKFPKLAAELIKRNIERTSMGCDVLSSECSYCGNIARVPDDYCPHVARMKGQRLRRMAADGTVEEVLVHEICRGLSFFENSLLVEDPADPTAFMFGLDVTGVLEEGGELSALAKSASFKMEASHSDMALGLKASMHADWDHGPTEPGPNAATRWEGVLSEASGYSVTVLWPGDEAPMLSAVVENYDRAIEWGIKCREAGGRIIMVKDNETGKSYRQGALNPNWQQPDLSKPYVSHFQDETNPEQTLCGQPWEAYIDKDSAYPTCERCIKIHGDRTGWSFPLPPVVSKTASESAAEYPVGVLVPHVTGSESYLEVGCPSCGSPYFSSTGGGPNMCRDCGTEYVDPPMGDVGKLGAKEYPSITKLEPGDRYTHDYHGDVTVQEVRRARNNKGIQPYDTVKVTKADGSTMIIPTYERPKGVTKGAAVKTSKTAVSWEATEEDPNIQWTVGDGSHYYATVSDGSFEATTADYDLPTVQSRWDWIVHDMDGREYETGTERSEGAAKSAAEAALSKHGSKVAGTAEEAIERIKITKAGSIFCADGRWYPEMAVSKLPSPLVGAIEGDSEDTGHVFCYIYDSSGDIIEEMTADGVEAAMQWVESNARLASKTAGEFEQTRSPAQVETLRMQECPVCGADAQWNSDGRCAVCGYLPPPRPFQEPDTDIAGRADRSGGWFDPDLTQAPPFAPPSTTAVDPNNPEAKDDDDEVPPPKTASINPVRPALPATKGQRPDQGDQQMAQGTQQSIATAARQRMAATAARKTPQQLADENARLRAQVAALTKKADPENPAQPVSEPSPGAPVESDAETLAEPDKQNVDVETPGGVLPDPQDAPADVTSIGGEMADPIVEGSNQTTDVETPVAGTTEVDPNAVRQVQPNTDAETFGDPAFAGDWLNPGADTVPDIGGNAAGAPEISAQGSHGDRVRIGRLVNASRDRIWASIRLANLQIQTGLAHGEMIDVAQQIEKSAQSIEAIQAQVSTLHAVASRRPTQQQVPTPGRVAGRQPQRTPNLAAGSMPVMGGLAQRVEDEALFE